MARLESGPARFERFYFLAIALALLGWAGWAVYDGATGWVNTNRSKARAKLLSLVDENLKSDVRTRASFGPQPTEKLFLQVQALNPRTFEEVRAKFGQPYFDRPSTDGRTAYFVSDYGMVSVPYGGINFDGRRMTWETWYKNEDEIFQQFYWAAGVAVLALYPLFRFYQAATLRVSVDDTALHYGSLSIPIGDIRSIRDYNKKGWVDIYYAAGGQERKLRLDNQKVARFDEIVDLLCRERGFKNPVRGEDQDDDDSPSSVGDSQR